MNEKRFIIVKSIENLYALVDKERKGKEQILIFSLHKEQLGVVCDLLNKQQATIEHLKKRLYDFEKRKIIEESEMDEDVIPKVKLLRAELFGEK